MIPRLMKFIYYVLITSAFCANILVVAQTTILSVLGASLALRGPDGSMMTATDGLYHERILVFSAFGHGLLLTIGSVVMVVWLHLHWETSLVCCAMSVCTIHKMRSTYYRIIKKFDFDESLTVDFQDIFDGPAAIQAVSVAMWRDMQTRGGVKTKKSPGIKTKKSHMSFDEDDDDDDNGSKNEEYQKFLRRQRSLPVRNGGGLEMV